MSVEDEPLELRLQDQPLRQIWKDKSADRVHLDFSVNLSDHSADRRVVGICVDRPFAAWLARGKKFSYNCIFLPGLLVVSNKLDILAHIFLEQFPLVDEVVLVILLEHPDSQRIGLAQEM